MRGGGNNLTVTVNVAQLIETIQANRDGHEALLAQAREGWRREAREKLEEGLNRLLAGKTENVAVFLTAPEDHTKEYDRAIGMLSRHTGVEIEIGAEDYACYVDDDWGWKQEWLTSNSRYTSR